MATAMFRKRAWLPQIAASLRGKFSRLTRERTRLRCQARCVARRVRAVATADNSVALKRDSVVPGNCRPAGNREAMRQNETCDGKGNGAVSTAVQRLRVSFWIHGLARRISIFANRAQEEVLPNSLAKRCVSFCNHPALSGEIEQATGIHYRPHVAEWFELINFAGVLHRHRGRVEVHRHHVAGFKDLT